MLRRRLMRLERNSVKRLGALGGLLAVLAVAGLWTVRAAAGPEAVYHVAGDSDADAAPLRAAIDPLFDDAVGETRALVIMPDGENENGRASGRERVCQYV